MMTRRALIQTATAASLLPLSARAAGGMQVLLGSPFLANGVTTDAKGRIYLSLPSWTGPSPGIGRLEGAEVVPFPGGAWHDPDTAPEDRLVAINAVHAFDDGLIWAVDQGGPEGGQKLLAFHPDGSLAQKLTFGRDILPEGAAMNDLRKDGAKIYVTDSGLGAIILHDLDSGTTLRRLSHHPLLRVDPDRVQVGTAGRPLQDENGKRPATHADMIELSTDGKWLYWAFPAGPLRRIETKALWTLDGEALAERIETVAEIPPIGGTAIDDEGNIYLSDVAARRIAVRVPDGRILTLVQDDRLISPDAIWIDADRHLMVPAAQTEWLPKHDKGENRLSPPYLTLGMTLPASLESAPLGRAVFVPKDPA
ncbi:SMP-30/gluconolactonase/LRE family protein [Falsirhodobacter sp. 20TX0035]|uniref:SMP-30/gluconolactonase/LRE family protein n=1 Tax=Falsirhodobacter sp. 20TX0035 TaxID=3022019 RepID=UPI002330196E|nr:hypothetical protein [Falsirhodobacter sp. 20TX0035]MDB6455110.1 hypothetical protein [Falsirhodobacter sp. 20TX0035]